MTRRGWVFDGAVALVVAALGVLEAFWGVDATHRQGPHWAQGLLYVVTAVLLVVRRVNPLGCLVAIVAVSIAEFATFGSPEGMGVALPGMIAAYTVGSRVEVRRSWWGAVLVALLWTGWAGFDPMNAQLADRRLSLVWLFPWVIAWLLGALVRTTRLVTEQRRLTREQRASRAVAEERNRIARELHDVIGHSVSVMTVQASAVRRRLSADQAVERQALETVEAVGREALTEMRRMVGVLRQAGDGADREPPPGLAQLDPLVEKFRLAGLPVRLQQGGLERPLAAGLDLTAYRLVQEGLTNTRKHAPGARVDVRISGAPGRGLEVSVVNPLPVGVAPAEIPGAGAGLTGLSERVALDGGTLRHGPEGGEFRLLAALPWPETTEVP